MVTPRVVVQARRDGGAREEVEDEAMSSSCKSDVTRPVLYNAYNEEALRYEDKARF